jgi:hypothetical protein
VNHDIDDAVRAGLLKEEDLPRSRVEVLGRSSSERIGRMVTDVVLQTIEGGMTEIRMSDAILDATVGLRSFLFEAVYENDVATAEFTKGCRHSWRVVEQGAGGTGEVSRPGHRPRGRPRRGGEGFPGRNDRPVRRVPVRATVHPQALGVDSTGIRFAGVTSPVAASGEPASREPANREFQGIMTGSRQAGGLH